MKIELVNNNPPMGRLTVVPAVYVILRKDNKVLLLRRFNTGYMNGKYTSPSGHFDGGETPEEVGVRETKEEADVDIKPTDLKLAHVMYYVADEGSHERVTFFFEAKQWLGEPKNAEPNKCDEIGWFSISDLPELVPELNHAFAQIKAGSIYSTFNF
jgi:8-oxo-dGTP diphosphatase